MAGLSLYLPACGSQPPKEGNAQPPKSDTLPDLDSAETETQVDEMEEAIESNNVIYVAQTDERFNTLNQAFNLRVSKIPALIALCKNTEGVADAIQYAVKNNLKVAVKSGGHSFENFSSINDGLQINLSLLNTIDWNDSEIVTIGPAVKLMEVYDELLPKNRVLPAGSCGTVGVGGLTLGGGYGFFARKYGLTCDNLLEATFVDGKGQIHRTQTGDELMWALKGGGNGNMGVVTEFKFRTHPAPDGFTRHRFKAYKLDKERVKELLQAYFKYTKNLPNTCFAAFVLNYKTMTLLITDYGDRSEALDEMIAAFKELSDKTDLGTKKNLAASLKNYYGIKHPIYFKNASAGYYDDFETIAGCIDDVLDLVFKKSGLIYQINTLGGAIADSRFESESCYPHRQSRYLCELQAYWEKGQNPDTLIQNFDQIQDVLYSHGIDKQYRNYPNLKFKNWEKAYFGEHYPKLQALKKVYDPTDLFTHEQTIKA